MSHRLATTPMIVAIAWAFPGVAAACPWCRGAVESGIYDEHFLSNALAMLAPAFILVGFALWLPARLERGSRGSDGAARD